MPLTGGEIRLDRSHDGRVANLTLSHGRYNVITWETRQVMADRFAEIDSDRDVQVVVVRALNMDTASSLRRAAVRSIRDLATVNGFTGITTTKQDIQTNNLSR